MDFKERIKMISTKEKILKASSTLFSEHGYKGTSVRKIASEVGIRESALYNHFKNKEHPLRSNDRYTHHRR